MPPTSWLVLVTPGMRTPIWPVDFMPAGIALSTSRVITFCCVTFCTSTVGDSPVTVIVSCERADPQVGVDRGGERAGQLDPFALAPC